MSEACGRQSLTIVVDNHRAEYYLIATVHINICNSIVVISLSLPRTIGIIKPAPTLLQCMCCWVYIKGYHLMTGIDTASKEDAWLLAIKIWSTEEMLSTAVTITIAPSFLKICFSIFESLQRIFFTFVWLTCNTVHIYKVFSTITHKPLSALGAATIILRSVAYNICRTISTMDSSAVSSTHHNFCLAVTIPVVGNDILLIVLEVTHIRSAVYPPQTGAIKLQCLEDAIFALVAFLRISCSSFVCVVKLHQHIELAIAIEVGTASIVRNQCTLDSFVLEFNLLIA